jgi:hypothetical protein
MPRPVFVVLAMFVVTVAAASSPPPGADKSAPRAVLAEGPLKVKMLVIREGELSGKGIEQEGELVLLTATRVLYKDKQGDLKSARGSTVKWVQTLDGQFRWNFDETARLFTGKAIPVKPFDFKPAEIKPAQEAQLLWYALHELTLQIDFAAGPLGSTALLKDHKDHVTVLAKHSQGRGLTQLAQLCLELQDHIDQQTPLVEERQKLVADYAKLLQNDKLKRAQFDQAQRQLTGGALLLGAVAVIAGDRDTLADVADAYSLAQQVLWADKAQYDLFTQQEGKKILEQYQAVVNKMADLRKDRDQKIDALAPALGLPPTEGHLAMAERLSKERDYENVIKAKENHARALQNAGAHGNPWLQMDLARLRAKLPSVRDKKNTAEMFRQAQLCADAAALFPKDAVYNRYRALFLWKAADLAVTAADLDVEARGDWWKDTYSPYAAWAARVFAHTDQYKEIIDTRGWARAVRVAALALAAQPEEALRLGVNLQDTSKFNPVYHCDMARLYAADWDNMKTEAEKKALKKNLLHHAERSQDVGFGRTVADNKDVKRLLGTKEFAAEFKQRVAPSVYATLQAAGGKYVVTLSNNSDFPLVLVQGKVKLTVRGKAKPEFSPASGPASGPIVSNGGKWLWQFGHDLDPQLLTSATLELECLQALEKSGKMSIPLTWKK